MTEQKTINFFRIQKIKKHQLAKKEKQKKVVLKNSKSQVI